MNHKISGFSLFALALLPSSFALGADISKHQAPALRQLVEDAAIPPLEERLPENPMVVEAPGIGRYGGVVRMNGRPDETWPLRVLIGAEMLFRFDNDAQSVPQLVEDYEISADARTYTLHLREGVRWSDGEPFTVDDVLFWFEDIALNQEFNPDLGLNGWLGGLPANYRTIVDDETVPPKMTKLDDFTLEVTFPEPNGAFVIGAASWENDIATRLPKHYLGQFHPAYNPEAEAMAEAEGHPNWPALMRAKMDWWLNSEMPTLHAWTLNVAMGESPVAEATRNPYYWKTDTDGNQLPYVDGIRFQSVEDNEVALLQTLSGAVDWKFETAINIPDNQGVFLDHAGSGGYRLARVAAPPSVISFDFNMTHPIPAKREVFANKDFRIGVSHALDRSEISDLIYLGQREPWQFAPTPGSPIYDEEFGTQYLEHSLELAEQYLNKVLPERDAEGYRLGPDGERFTFNLQTAANNTTGIAVLELMEQHLEKVGLETTVDPVEASLFHERAQANQFDTILGGTTTGSFPVVMYFNPFPVYTWPNNAEYNAVLWSNWYLGIEPSEEPPAKVIEALSLFDEMKRTPDADEQLRLAHEIMSISRELFMTMGIVRWAPNYAIVSADLKNLREPAFPQPFAPATVDPEIWFYDR